MRLLIPTIYKKTFLIGISAFVLGWILEFTMPWAYGKTGMVIIIGAISYCAYAYLPWFIVSSLGSILLNLKPPNIPPPISFETWTNAELLLRMVESFLIVFSASIIYGFLYHVYSTIVVRDNRKAFRLVVLSVGISLLTTWVQFLRRPVEEVFGTENWISLFTNLVARLLTGTQEKLLDFFGLYLPSFQLGGTRMTWEDLVISNTILFWMTFVLILLLCHIVMTIRKRFQINEPNHQKNMISSTTINHAK